MIEKIDNIFDKVVPPFLVLAFLVLLIECLVMFCRPINKVLFRRECTVTVTDKEMKNGKYFVYTEDEDENGDIQVFEITNALFAWQFDSSDIYAGIEVGKTYIFDIGGDGEEILPWYPNIYEYEEVDNE